MDDRALEVLEYPAVIERCARHASFSAGRAAIEALRPIADREVVIVRQRETAEAAALHRDGLEIPFGGAHDVRTHALAAARGVGLAAADLLNVADLVRAAEGAQRLLSRTSAATPRLTVIAAGMAELGPLRTLILDALDDRGEVKDTASPTLQRVRRDVVAVHDRLQQRMEAMTRTPNLRNALQEPIVTLRGGRYVLPVKADFRGALPGVVHDTSASGATLYIEPMGVVDLGNDWRELQLAEQHEVERILLELSEAVGEVAADIVDTVERLAHLDATQAKARYGRELRALDLTLERAESWLVDAPGELRFVEARHPLLDAEVVANTIEVGGDTRALLITGPNTGGKTVALKTAGLLCLMALAGLPVPAEAGTRVPVYSAVFADIGDEQSIEQSLSTFSGHISAIIDIIERADAQSLVLLDEIGAGTDPTEGAQLGIAIVDQLISAGATLIATTHHSELKLYAHETDGVQNASVEFDVETLSPTYRLTIGLPGQSNALAIAANLGMPHEVIERARGGLSRDERDLERVLGELRAQLTAAEQRAERAAADAEEANRLRLDLREQLDTLARESAGLREDARARVRGELRDVERLLERTRRDVEAARLEQAEADLARAARAAEELAPPPEPPAAATELAATVPGPDEAPVTVVPGAVVYLRGVSVPGEALSDPDERGEFDVQLGALRTRARLEQVEQTEAPDEDEPRRVRLPAAPFASESIEVRGQTIDEAVPAVELFLDQAARAGLARVRIIHGRGTGTLRRAVRELLASHPLVTSYETAEPAEGGVGVTVVRIAGT
jgi:DNA mismatch repair protein MutS2